MKPKHRSIAWILVGLLWLLFLTAALWLYLNHPNGAGDFAIYYRGALRVIDGTPLYTNLHAGEYQGPPLVVQLTAPIVALTENFQQSAVVWFVVNVLMLVGTLAALLRYLPGQRTRLSLVAASVFFSPILVTLWWGQSSPLVFALTAWAWIAYKEKKPLLTGVLLAIAVWTKFYPGLLIVYFIWKRESRVTAGAIIGTIVVTAFQAGLCGVEVFLGYFTDVLPTLFTQGEPSVIYGSHSILSFAQRLFGEAPQVIPVLVNPVLLTITRVGLSLALLVTTTLAISRPVRLSQTPPGRFDLEYILVLHAALLLGSTLGTYSLVSILLSFILILRNTPRPRIQLTGLGLFITGVLMTLHPLIVIGYLQPPSENTLPALALALPFFAMVMLWGLVAFVLFKQQQVAATTDNIRTAPAAGSRSRSIT